MSDEDDDDMDDDEDMDQCSAGSTNAMLDD